MIDLFNPNVTEMSKLNSMTKYRSRLPPSSLHFRSECTDRTVRFVRTVCSCG